MITVLIAGAVYRQVPATLHARAYWLRYACQNAHRAVQVWETAGRVSYRLN